MGRSPLKEIEKLVKPSDTARVVTFECADSCTTSLFREDLGRRRALGLQTEWTKAGRRLQLPPSACSSKQIRLQKLPLGSAPEVYPKKKGGISGRDAATAKALMWKDDRFNR